MGSIAPWCRAKEQHCLTAEKSANNVNSHPKQRTIQTRILEPSPGLKSWQSECILKSQPTAVRLGTLPLSLPCVAVCIKSHVTIKCHWWFLYGNAAQNSTPSKVLMNAKFSVPGLPAVENAQHWLLLDLGLLPVWELALTVVLISTSLIMTKVEHLFIMAKSCLYLFFSCKKSLFITPVYFFSLKEFFLLTVRFFLYIEKLGCNFYDINCLLFVFFHVKYFVSML